jgi:hypothetical protein
MRARYLEWRKGFDSLVGDVNGQFNLLERRLQAVEPLFRRAQSSAITSRLELSDWLSGRGVIQDSRRETRSILRGLYRRGFDLYIVMAPQYVTRCLALTDRISAAILGEGVELVGEPSLHFGDVVPCAGDTHEWGPDTIGVRIILRTASLQATALCEFRVEAATERISLTPSALVSVCHSDPAVRSELRQRARQALQRLEFPLNAGVGKVSLPGQVDAHLYGEEVSRCLILYLKQEKGRRAKREVIVPPSLPNADVLVRVFLPQLKQQIETAIHEVAAQNAADYRPVSGSLSDGPAIDANDRSLRFSAHFDFLQQGGTNPLEWEYWVKFDLGMKAVLTPKGADGFTVETTVISDRVTSVGGRWRQGGDLFTINVDDARVLNFIGAAKTGMNGKHFNSDLTLNNLFIKDISYTTDSIYLIADMLTCS